MKIGDLIRAHPGWTATIAIVVFLSIISKWIRTAAIVTIILYGFMTASKAGLFGKSTR